MCLPSYSKLHIYSIQSGADFHLVNEIPKVAHRRGSSRKYRVYTDSDVFRFTDSGIIKSADIMSTAGLNMSAAGAIKVDGKNDCQYNNQVMPEGPGQL